jgi:hypothetical protein
MDRLFLGLGMRGGAPATPVTISTCDPTCHHHIKELWIPEQLHGCIVNVHMRKLNIWVFFVHSDDNFFPQLTDL